jgi:hypothetical protein
MLKTTTGIRTSPALKHHSESEITAVAAPKRRGAESLRGSNFPAAKPGRVEPALRLPDLPLAKLALTNLAPANSALPNVALPP